MSIIESIFLGVLQGISEFLPISSSGHLKIAEKLLGLQNTPFIFTIFLHLATLFSVIFFFHKIITDLFQALIRFIIKKKQPNDDQKLQMILALLAGTTITAVVGLLLRSVISELSLKITSIGFIITALLLILADIRGKQTANIERISPSKNSAVSYADTLIGMELRGNKEKSVSLLSGIIIGFAQGFGLFPGVSRSGITISAAILCGVDRKIAGDFSFLLAIPAILGAFILELEKVKDFTGLATNLSVPVLLIGGLSAFFAGLLALFFLIKLIQKGSLFWFACYLIPLGIAGIIFF